MSFEPHKEMNVIVGVNGMGKTNLLDAINYVSVCRSYFHKLDKYAVQTASSFFRIDCQVVEEGREKSIVFKVQPGKKKELLHEGKILEKLSDHLGKVPSIMIAPDDIHTLLSGSEERRRLMDLCICQYDHNYLQKLVKYKKVLKMRNSYLKSLEASKPLDEILLTSYDRQLVEPAQIIYTGRSKFLALINPQFQEISKTLAGNRENLELQYDSQLDQNSLSQLLLMTRKQDYFRKRTHRGTHRDDLLLLINNHPLKIYASQGQLKSYLLSLKLAQYKILQNVLGKAPILILDDIFDKLDQKRVLRLIHYLKENQYGQVFISDTHPERVINVLKSIQSAYRRFHIENGEIIKIDD